MDIQIAILGILIGAVMGLTGAGGAIIAVPALFFVCSLSPAQAAPIALLTVFLAASVGAFMGLRQGIVRYRAASLIAIAGIVLTPFGVWLADKIPSRALTLLFACVLLFAAIRMLLEVNRDAKPDCTHPSESLACEVGGNPGRIIWDMHCARVLAATGALGGLLSGLLGVGGGFIFVPALKKYSNVPMTQIVPTSLSVIALISLIGATSAIYLGKMLWQIAIPFAFGSLIGMLLTRSMAQRFSPVVLQRMFAILSILISVGLMIKAFL